MNKLIKISGRYQRHITEKEYQKGQSDFIVFKGLDNINKTLHYVLSYKGETEKVKNKNVDYIL